MRILGQAILIVWVLLAFRADVYALDCHSACNIDPLMVKFERRLTLDGSTAVSNGSLTLDRSQPIHTVLPLERPTGQS